MNVIDCDAEPFNPREQDGWTVKEHQKDGLLIWDASRVELWLAYGQKDGRVLQGTKLRAALRKKRALNANVLDYLLANPELIPEEWKSGTPKETLFIFFWGTVYRDPGGNCSVRCLGWTSGKWSWSYDYLINSWDGNNPAAVLAS